MTFFLAPLHQPSCEFYRDISSFSIEICYFWAAMIGLQWARREERKKRRKAIFYF